MGEMSLRHGCFRGKASLLPAPHSFFCQQAGCSEGQHAAARTRAGPWFSDPQPPQMLDTTSGPRNRKLKHPVDKAALCPLSVPWIL